MSSATLRSFTFVPHGSKQDVYKDKLIKAGSYKYDGNPLDYAE